MERALTHLAAKHRSSAVPGWHVISETHLPVLAWLFCRRGGQAGCGWAELTSGWRASCLLSCFSAPAVLLFLKLEIISAGEEDGIIPPHQDRRNPGEHTVCAAPTRQLRCESTEGIGWWLSQLREPGRNARGGGWRGGARVVRTSFPSCSVRGDRGGTGVGSASCLVCFRPVGILPTHNHNICAQTHSDGSRPPLRVTAFCHRRGMGEGGPG